MKRSIVSGAALAATAALVLSGCAGGAAAPTTKETLDPNKKITLTVTTWGNSPTSEFTALFEAFHAKYPNITVEPVDIIAANYPEKLTLMLASGDTTDVIGMKSITDYPKYASRGQLADVSDIAKKYGDELAGTDAYEIDGKYYAMPFRQDFWLLYYNKDLFDKAGLDYPDNITWEQYAEYAKKLTSGTGPEKVYGTYTHTWPSLVQAISAAQTDGDLLSGDYGFMKDQYELTLGLQKDGDSIDYATAKSQQITYPAMFATGRTAMMPMGSWYIGAINAEVESGKSSVNWGVAQLPQLKADGKVTTIGAPTSFSVNKKAKNPEAAKLFLDFASSEEGAKAVASRGIVPAYSSDAVAKAFTALPTDELSVKAFAGKKKVVLEMPISDISSDVWTILSEQHDLIMVGEKSVKDGVAEMGDRVKAEVLQ